MIFAIVASILLAVLAAGGLCFGVKIARVIADQFDELMPQRMIDYSGFVEMGSQRE